VSLREFDTKPGVCRYNLFLVLVLVLVGQPLLLFEDEDDCCGDGQSLLLFEDEGRCSRQRYESSSNL
jgi:hypothetical protein